MLPTVSNLNELLPVSLPPRSGAPFAAVSANRRKRRNKSLTPEEEATLRGALQKLPDEQLELLELASWQSLTKGHKVVDVDGTKARHATSDCHSPKPFYRRRRFGVTKDH